MLGDLDSLQGFQNSNSNLNDFFNFDAQNNALLERQTVTTNPANANVTDSYAYDVLYPFPAVADSIRVVLTNVVGNFIVGETVAATTSGSTGVVKSWDSTGNILVVSNPTAYFVIPERVTGASSGAIGDVQSSTNVYV